MILRHLANSLRKQDWFTVVLEVLIVVVGIFIGLQVDDWNQARKDHLQEAVIIERLHADFEDLVTTIEAAVVFNQGVLADLQVIIGAINAGRLPENQKAAFVSGLAWGYVDESPAGRSGTFVEISSSGTARLLRDDGLRAALQKYDLNVVSAHNAWLEIRGVQNLYIKDFTRYFTYTEQTDPTENLIREFDLEAILTDPDFKNAVYEIRQTQLYFLRWHGTLLEYARTVLQQLEKLGLQQGSLP